MFNSLAREQEFRIASQPLESVKECVCLGELLTGDPDHEKEIYRIVKNVAVSPERRSIDCDSKLVESYSE